MFTFVSDGSGVSVWVLSDTLGGDGEGVDGAVGRCRVPWVAGAVLV
jgi:hypothetical protein